MRKVFVWLAGDDGDADAAALAVHLAGENLFNSECTRCVMSDDGQ
jgi:hypothetical protein